MTDYFAFTAEFCRHTLTAYARALSLAGFEPGLKEEPDAAAGLVLSVPAGGPSGFEAVFSVADAGEDSMTLSAFYASPILEKGISDFWQVSPSADPGAVSRELIVSFLHECRDRELDELLVPAMINDENLPCFAPLLSDRILTGENVYAIGVFMREGDDLEIAAAGGFYASEDRLVIEDINVLPEFSGIDIEGYLVRYIRNMVTGLDIM